MILGDYASYLLTALISFVCAGGGAYLGSYLKKKGENLATHEDIDKLVKQVEATTEATKSIEARISNEVWGKQREWEFKRDALLEGGRAVADFLAAIQRLNAIYATKDEASADEEIAYLKALSKSETDAITAVNQAAYSLQRAQLVLSIVSGKATQIAFVKIERLYKNIVVKIVDGDAEAVKRDLALLKEYGSNLTLAIRRELGFDDSEFSPQST